jgi:hypothetical protein
MAKVIFGPGISDLRGRCGSVVYYRNRQGPVMRTWKAPVQPNSPQQQMMQAWQKTTGEAWWATLTQPQRDGWAARAKSVFRVNTIGQRHTITPCSLFIRRNMLATIAGGSPILDAPDDINPVGPGLCTLAASSSTQIITLTPTVSLPSGYGVIIRASKPESPGLYNFNAKIHSIITPGSTYWTDAFTGTHPVPPWEAGGIYTAANWNEAGGILTAHATGDLEDIHAGIPLGAVTITCTLQPGDTGTVPNALSARVNTVTGAKYLLAVHVAGKTIYHCRSTGWTNASVIVLNTYNWAAADYAPHVWVWTLVGTKQTLTIDAAPIFSTTDATIATGHVGLCVKTNPVLFSNYSAVIPPSGFPTIPDISQPYLNKWGALIATKKIATQLRYVNLTTGQPSIAQICTCIVS